MYSELACLLCRTEHESRDKNPISLSCDSKSGPSEMELGVKNTRLQQSSTDFDLSNLERDTSHIKFEIEMYFLFFNFCQGSCLLAIVCSLDG